MAAAAAAFYAGTGGVLSADPELAKLLKGMAIIKTAILLAVGAAIWWKLESFGATGMAGTTLVWNVAGLGFAPFLFDGGLLGFLISHFATDNGIWLRALTQARSRRSQ